MSMSIPNTTAQFFDSYATDFNAIYGNNNSLGAWLINRLFRQAMVVRYQRTLIGCDQVEGSSILDVGCGPGHYSVALAERGAAAVLGIDFAERMVELARARARESGVAARCRFEHGDLLTYPLTAQYDYAVVMGFMDYVTDPERIVSKIAAVVRRKAFFSFPAAGGVLAWQRKVRYRRRCDLFMYRREDVECLMKATGLPYRLESIGRDYFVTLRAGSAHTKGQ